MGGGDINAVARSTKQEWMAVADDSGLVRLLNYPCVVETAPGYGHRGHASHIEQVMMNSASTMRNCVLKMMTSALKRRNFAFKMMNQVGFLAHDYRVVSCGGADSATYQVSRSKDHHHFCIFKRMEFVFKMMTHQWRIRGPSKPPAPPKGTNLR